MNAEIITVGTELLLGDIVDSNSQFLSRELAEYGINMLYKSTVGDNGHRLSQVLSLALSRSDLVVITGGLGPTQDDLTRETVCETLGIPLEFHEESWRRIQEYFAASGRDIPENNRKQAMLPHGAVVFPNDHGTAPGCAVKKYGQCVILLPGPPKELIPMFSDYVAPYLAEFSGGTIFSRTVGVFGLSESALAERLADLMSEANPTVAPYAGNGEVVLRVTAHAADTEAARRLCDPVVEEIRSRLGAFVYGVDAGSLQKTAVALLKDKGMKIATAESCTAGMLSGRLTEVPGASSVFECGVAAYSKEIKHDVLGVPEDMLEELGAVSPEVACAMAIGARRVGHADLGVGITGVAGPDPSEGKPVGTVYIALADDKRTWVKQITAGAAPGDRESVRWLATSHALDLVRRYLEALPSVMAGGETIEEPPSDKVAVIPRAEAPRKRRLWTALFPHRGDGRAKNLQKVGMWAAFLLLAAAAALAVQTFLLAPKSNSSLSDDLRDMYNTTATGVTGNSGDFPADMLSQFYSLYTLNDAVRGWVRIDGTNIDYPVVQGLDNVYYRNHSFNKNFSEYGTPFFSSSVSFTGAAVESRSMTIFGNNTDEILQEDDGQMFSQLTLYAASDMEFLKAHPVIEMNTIYENANWKIFGVFVMDDQETDTFDFTRSQFESDEDFLAFVSAIRARSLFHLPVEVDASDHLLLLTTEAEELGGFDGARLVVAARQVREGESAESDLSTARVNREALMPERWPAVIPDASDTLTSSAFSGTDTTTGTGTTTETSDNAGEADSTAETTGATTAVPTTATTTEGIVPTTTATTTTTTETPTTPPTTPSTDPPDTPGLVEGKVNEAEYLQYFRIRDTRTDELIEPSNRAELQRAVSLIVKKEMGMARMMVSSTEAQKAQAVAAYTFVLSYVADKGAPYSFSFPDFNPESDSNDKRIYDAVGEVLGIKLLDLSASDVADQPCETTYFAYSAPYYTASNQEVYQSGGLPTPYLQGVYSAYDSAEMVEKYLAGSMSSTCTITWAELKQKLETQLGSAVDTDAAAGQCPIRATKIADGGYYVVETNLTYNRSGSKAAVTGNQIRNAIGVNKLKSHAFTITYDPSTDRLTFTAQGYGHGVGLSQIGAVGYANEAGWNYIQILSHYYSITSTTTYQLVAPRWGSIS